MNRSDIRQRILDGLNEALSTPVHFSSTQINEVITEASEILAEEAEAVRRTVFVPLEEGKTYYSTPAIASDLMMPVRLWTYDNNRPLTAVGLRELDEHSETWEDTSGTPEAWCSISWDIFAIYPHPATSGGVLRMDYLAWPRELMDDSDEPEFPLSAQDGLVKYGIYTGLLKRYDVQSAIDILNDFTTQWERAAATSGINRSGTRVFSRPSTPNDIFTAGVNYGRRSI